MAEDQELLNDNVVIVDDPDALETQVVPPGTYKAVISQANWVKNDEAAPYNAGVEMVKWSFTLDDPDHSDFQGHRLWRDTPTEVGKGWEYKRFMTGLGQVDQDGRLLREIPLNDLVEMEIMINLDVGQGKKRDPITNKTRPFNKILEIFPR